TGAVHRLDPVVRAAILPHPPADDEHLRWVRVGEMLGQVDGELSAEGLSVNDVMAAGGKIDGFADHARWEAFHAARQAYHGHLNVLGLWDRHAARLVAIEQREIECDLEIVLLGMVDLN